MTTDAPTYNERATWANKALTAYMKENFLISDLTKATWRDSLRDLMTDLLHLANQSDIIDDDPLYMNRKACDIYRLETNRERRIKP